MKSRMRFLTVPTVGETYQYDGYENQVLMAPNYAESVAAVPMPMIFHQNVVNTPVTEVQTPIAATATVSHNGFLSFQVLGFFLYFIYLLARLYSYLYPFFRVLKDVFKKHRKGQLFPKAKFKVFI